MLGQHGDVAFARAQRRHLEGDDAQPPVEVLAEFALFDHFAEVAVGGGDDAHVDLDRLGAADALDGLLAEGAQQLHLRGGVYLADFVEEKRAAVRQLEAPDAPLLRAGEGALLMAEELAFQNLRRERRAMHGDELGGGPAAEMVDGAGRELLAGAAFPLDEHGGACGRHLLDGFEDGLERVGFADDALDGEFLPDLLLERGVFLLQMAAAQGAFDEQLHLVEIQRLGDEMVGPAPHRLHRRVHAAVGGHHDADGRLRQSKRLLQQLHAVVLAESEIGEHHVYLVMAQMLQRLGRVRGHITVEVILQ